MSSWIVVAWLSAARAEPPEIPQWQAIDRDSQRLLPAELRSDDEEVRAEALRALGGTIRDTAILEVVLRTDPSPDLRAQAFRLVLLRWDAGIQPEWHRDMIRWQLEEGFPPDRVNAARALVDRVNDPTLLEAGLSDPLPEVREPLLQRLVALHDPVSIEILRDHQARESKPALWALAQAAIDVADGRAPPPSEPEPLAVVPAPEPVPEPAPREPEPAPEPRPVPGPITVFVPEPTTAPPPLPPPGPARRITGSEAGAPILGAAYGGYLGGLTGWLVGEALEEREADHQMQGVAPGWLLGTLTGVGTASLVATLVEVPTTEPLTVGSTTLLGGVVGGHLGAALIPPSADGADERMQAAGLGGSLGGFGVGLLLPFEPDPLDMVHVDGAAGLGWLVASGVSDVAGLELEEDRQLRGAIGVGGTLAFGAFAAGLSQTHLSAPRAQTFVLTTAQGAWIGSMAPYLFTDRPSDAELTGGLRIGLGAAYLGGVAWMAAGQPSPTSAALQGVGALAGNALGAGIPLAIGGDGPTALVVGPMLAGGVVGQVAGGLLAPRYHLSDQDLLLMGVLGGWTTWQTAGWSTYASMTTDDGTRVAGHALAAAGAGTVVATPLLAAVDLPAPSSVELMLAGGWGTWFGAWSSQLGDLSPDAQMLATLAAGDTAVVATAVVEGVGLHPDWRDLAVSNGGGLLGAAGGGLVGVLFLYQKEDWDPLVTSTVVGSGVGLLAGTAAAVLTHPSDPGVALRAPEVGALPVVALAPWTDPDGRPGVWLELASDRW